MKIRDVMHQPVKCCDSSASLDQVASEMWNDDLGIVPIVDQEHRLLGVVTDRDIAMAATLKHKPLWEISAQRLSVSKIPLMESSVMLSRKQEDSCGLGEPALKSVGVAWINQRSLIRL